MRLGILVVVGAFLLVGCAHYPDVRPGAEGTHRVVVKSNDEQEGTRNAINQANDFCDDRYEKIAAFLKEDQKYTGDMDKKQYKDGRRATKVAKTVGGVLGGAGAVIGDAGDATFSDGFTTDMRFKCK